MSIATNPRDSKPELAQELVAAARCLAPKGLGRLKSNGWYTRNCLCPSHADTDPSCSVKEDGSLYCHACDEYWSQREAAELLGINLDDDVPRNRYQRRRADATLKKRRKQLLELYYYVETRMPRHLRRLAKRLLHASIRFGTCAMSQERMGRIVGRTRETICRQMAQLRALGFVKKLGYYVIGFDPGLHHHGLEMRVNIESPYLSEIALASSGRRHTMLLIQTLASGELPQCVWLTGWIAKIRWKLRADDGPTTGRRRADDRPTTGRRPADDGPTTGRRPADDG